jgi:tRNA(His) 5'-end guanylyltransferase
LFGIVLVIVFFRKSSTALSEKQHISVILTQRNAFAHQTIARFDNDKFIVFDSRCVVLSDEFFGTIGVRKHFR